jgi:hypothetical protein
MSGIVNASPAPSDEPAAPSDKLSNPLLQEIEDRIEANLAPETRQAYNQIVVAGLHAALDKGPQGMIAPLLKSPDPIKGAATGAVGLVLILRKEAKGVMPIKAMVPAAMTLMVKALGLLDRAGIVKIGEPEIERATHLFTDFMFARMGITKASLANATRQVDGITRDPQKVAALNLKGGVTRHPMAATQTPLPPSGPPGMINGGGAGA